MFYDLYSVDSWNYDGCWTDNAAYLQEREIYLSDDTTVRQLLKFMRRNGWLSEYSKGRVTVNRNWSFIEVCERNGRVLYRFVPDCLRLN